MSYLKTILQPNEKILYMGKVHWIVLVPGISLIVAGWIVATQIPYIHKKSYAIMTFGSWLQGMFPSLPSITKTAIAMNESLPSLFIDPKWIGFGIFLFGLRKVIYGTIQMMTTELAITPYRILSKSGLYTIFIAEIDRHRVAGTYVLQPIWGRMLNYGFVAIQGFSGSISGLPPMRNPRKLQSALIIS